MPRVRMGVACERRARVLACLCSAAGEDGRAVRSIGDVARESGLSFTQARSSLKYLADRGAVRVESRSLPNGGCAENAYVVTPRAAAVLQDLRARCRAGL